MQMEEGLVWIQTTWCRASNAQQKRGETELENKKIINQKKKKPSITRYCIRMVTQNSRMMDCQSMTKLS
jgi:hypothetical protein